MKLVILHPNKTSEITDPKFIPRIGERIMMGFYPAPIVREVLYDFDEDVVTVVVS